MEETASDEAPGGAGPLLPAPAGIRGRLRRALGAVDAAFDRLYGWRLNPLYHSGALALVLFGVALVTGIYLLIFYRVGAPYESVARMEAQVWSGRWMRALHRYASDAAIVATLVHALRVWLQGRAWGPRAVAWVSGLLLLGAALVTGWTGFVMVWDVHAEVLAREAARLLDLLPLFSDRLERAFSGEGPVPGAFFFLNLFVHIALPVGVLLLLWIHVSRLSRPRLLPPWPLTWAVLAVLGALSVMLPLGMAAPADPFRLPGRVPLDVFYNVWLPLSRALPAWTVWLAGGLGVAALAAVPLWTRPAPELRPALSRVDERLCTGCEQCALDCPYEAIEMVGRSDGRAGLVAGVDAALCVSCGICAGSCAPMGVGPPGRSGRDQLERVRAFLKREAPRPGDVVLVACDRGAGDVGQLPDLDGARVYPVSCAGSLHTSVVELLVRSGAAVLVASCPPRDCWNREGTLWLEARLYEGREAELRERVDRRRLRLLAAGAGDRAKVRAALRGFREALAALGEGGAGERDGHGDGDGHGHGDGDGHGHGDGDGHVDVAVAGGALETLELDLDCEAPGTEPAARRRTARRTAS